MPIKVIDQLPAVEALSAENVFVMTESRAAAQDIRPLRIAILNLMPNKIVTEIQLLRLLANSPLQLDIELIRIDDHVSKHTPESHLNCFYRYFSDVQGQKYDGLIITGAPLGLVDYEDVTYWQQFGEILRWADTHVTSTLFLCWAAHAALYHYYGLQREIRGEKLSGVYWQDVVQPFSPLLRGFDQQFLVPHSRYAQVPKQKYQQHDDLHILAEADVTGAYLLQNSSGSRIFVTGHPEYDLTTLDDEYQRDLAAGLAPRLPENYYRNNDPAQGPLKLWQAHAFLLFSNWLNYYVYQATPFDLNQIGNS
ncbi:MAG: homoserine O-succinyltransferase [Alishewanella agri]|jgi:homoserine O-succinyltransferase|uniref:Homoserine O-succinyltransferase n=2 Tax=Alishewanella TaxID=111142 RepID=H3ZH49_9ALTE|nr:MULTISPECIES: homoserine O-succinyltransferase [Alishewanella]MDD4862617.1 homoserine O-succinyltransferase [Alishewanella agri]OYW96014.1 MAG: homoserine O-succinyltransferase [Alishewanella sp. 32-51-5]EHR40189.1 homoserine O-succinyltransferase [Alishewanella jeotgali KCTC 22429]EJI86540.1 homoserine O-succinyltransferase [Alishewanella aestuarii B11]KRS21047.1 homoserine O-succinyltransferase [Alishewanella sp. WH16-1]